MSNRFNRIAQYAIAFPILVTVFTAPLSATTVFVDAGASGLNNGTSWEHAFLTLQQGIAAAQDPLSPVDLVLVADGIYSPGTLQSNSFTLAGSNEYSGGWVGAADPSAHDPDLYPTILSGELGVAGLSDNVDRVVRFGPSGGFVTRFNGFQVTGARTNGVTVDQGAVPEIEFCTITGNNRGVSCALNTAPIFRDCIISQNSAPASVGAGISASGGDIDAKFIRCTIAQNSAIRGGGVNIDQAGLVELINCTISGNSVSGAADSNGGGLRVVNGAVRLANCVILGNTAEDNGGGIYSGGSTTMVRNCTIVANSATLGGGFAEFNQTIFDATIHNSILWDNTGSGAQVYVDVSVQGEPVTITYSDIQGGLVGIGGPDEPNWGAGNFDPALDPLFVNAGDGIYL
ncbi:MAG: right-handed parallel beta-helix repeat-containing protein, partial [Phycisphaerales bacterium]|nr:right-handed parallel beta-helix repeat-containing protein [Phycisphaerales bacterium]